ncbi:MAG: hypothetical protein FVQ82_17130 [Planctomycetes bacterium]|nr:hypothetical protein [Planctomycetota bacterium]
MAKKKKKTSLGLFGPKKKKKKKKTKAQAKAGKEATVKRIRIFSVIFVVVFAAAAVCGGFFYLEKYAKRVSPVALRTGQLVFPHDNVPEWFNEELAGLMRDTAGGREFELNEKSAKTVGEKLSTLAWLDGLKVQTTKDSLRVTAKYRKPIAMIKLGDEKYCIDNNLVAMRYLKILKLPIVEITGSTLDNIVDIYVQEDIEAAVKLIRALSLMDKEIKPKPPLLEDIARIDVSNFDGRNDRSKSKSHINLYIKDGKHIFWGNALGKTTGKIEATDEEKLSSLYDLYVRNGKNSLLDRDFTWIDLRNPR